MLTIPDTIYARYSTVCVCLFSCSLDSIGSGYAAPVHTIVSFDLFIAVVIRLLLAVCVGSWGLPGVLYLLLVTLSVMWHVPPCTCAQGLCGGCPPGSGVMSDILFFHSGTYIHNFLAISKHACPDGICLDVLYVWKRSRLSCQDCHCQVCQGLNTEDIHMRGRFPIVI